jgi:hypothetical protein
MNIDFWYSNISGGTGIQTLIEKLGLSTFKDIGSETPDSSKMNFLVFQWETSNAVNPINQYQTHSDEFISLLKRLQNEGFYFIADFSTEAHTHTDELSLKFIHILDTSRIDLKRLLLAKNDSLNTGIRRIKYGNYTLNACFFPHFFVNTFYKMQEYVESTDTIVKDKTFLCLNRRLHLHKYKTLEQLYRKGLLEDTHYTAVKSYIDLPSFTFLKKLPIQLDGDIMYGDELSIADEHLYRINPNWYHRSKVNIITETLFEEDGIHITEKTWKAIYLGIPFVVCASLNHLDGLKRMGFETFHSVIDESYDSRNDHFDKISQIIDSAVELSKIWDSDVVKSIIEFNKALYFNEEHRKYIVKTMFLDEITKINRPLVSLI